MAHPVLHRVLRTARSVRAVVAQPPYVPPGHFYSPLTDGADIARASTWRDAPGVNLDETAQLSLAARLTPVLGQPMPGPRYYTGTNRMFGGADASAYRALLRHEPPRRVIEVGSGYSTALLLDEMDAYPVLAGAEVTCIEPYTDRLESLMRPGDQDRLRILRQPVQEVGLGIYEQLGAGDILFIDSTHIAKAGSDVNWLLLHVLPRLGAGVRVHVHDIFWPFEYPQEWLNEHRDWTENYLLHAFLVGNVRWEIVLFLSWLWKCHPDFAPAGMEDQNPGSIWLRSG